MDVGTFSWGTLHFLLHLLCNFTGQRHSIEGKFVLPSSALHDGRQEGLGIEEARQPDGGRKVEVRCPALQLLDPQQEVGVPGGQPVQRGVGQLGPGDGNLNTVCQLAVTEVGLTWSRYKELESSSISWVIVSSPFSPRSSSLRDLLISVVRLFILSHS